VNATIENNLIEWSDTYGIQIDSWDNTRKWISNPIVKNNTIYKTARDGPGGVGIQIATYSNPIIEDTRIIDWGEDAIFFGQWCQAIVKNCSFDAQGGNYALASSAPRNVTVINSTIEDNNVRRDLSLATAYFKITNTTFNQSKVIFQGTDSNLTVNWFLNAYINDTLGNSIPDVNIRIQDNVNGTYDQNLTTDANGYLNWTVLKEYFQKDLNGDKDGDDPGERINYSSYNITVSKPGYQTAYAEVEMNESKTVIITLTDIEKPIADAGFNQTVNEDTIVYLDGSGSTDNVGIVNYTWSFYDGGLLVNLFGINASYIFAQPGTYTITLNVSDASGNWDTDTCLINVNDVTVPVANTGPDQSVDEDDMIQFDGNGSTDNVGIVWYNWTFSDGNYQYGTDATSNHTYTNAGNYIVTLNVSDAAGNWATDTCLVFVNNVAPIANAGSDITANEGEIITFDGSFSNDTASDQTNLTFVWYFGDGNSETGKVVTHAYADNDVYTATLVVTDDNGYVDSDTCNVTVNNVAPVIMPVGNQTVQQGILFMLKINATDVPADTLTFSDNTTLFDINPVTGIIQFTPTDSDIGMYFVRITVMDDDSGSNSTTFKLTVLNVNDQPTLIYISPQTATEDAPFSLQLVGQDVDVGDTLTYSMITSPSGMTINQATGLISWMPTNGDVGSHTAIVRVSDASGAFAERSFQITVANVNDPPMIITTALSNATEGSMYVVPIQAEDVDGDVLTFSFDSAPPFLSINAETGLIYGMPTNNDVGLHQIVVNVSDGTAFVTRAFNLTVLNVNDLPVIASYPIAVAKPGSEYTYTIIAEDTDAGDVLAYSLVEAPEGMTINGHTGRITWTPPDAQAGQTYQVVVRVSDGNGSTTQTYSIAVDDLPAEPYRPLFDDYVWIGIIIMLISIILLLLFYQHDKGRKEKEEQEIIEKMV
jgi:hypothetical protein